MWLVVGKPIRDKCYNSNNIFFACFLHKWRHVSCIMTSSIIPSLSILNIWRCGGLTTLVILIRLCWFARNVIKIPSFQLKWDVRAANTCFFTFFSSTAFFVLYIRAWMFELLAAIFVPLRVTPIWHLQTKIFKFG